VAQPREQLVDGLNDKSGPIAVLDIGGVHLPNQQTARVGHNVAPTPFDLLGRIATTRPATLGGLDRLTVDDPGRWARFTAHRFARLQQQRKIDLLKQYEREGQRYASDLTDAEWVLIEPQMPAVKPLGRPRETELRAVLDAILYIARTGCQWRMLPKGCSEAIIEAQHVDRNQSPKQSLTHDNR
jgi:hypothetical protein